MLRYLKPKRSTATFLFANILLLAIGNNTRLISVLSSGRSESLSQGFSILAYHAQLSKYYSSCCILSFFSKFWGILQSHWTAMMWVRRHLFKQDFCYPSCQVLPKFAFILKSYSFHSVPMKTFCPSFHVTDSSLAHFLLAHFLFSFPYI